INCLTRSRRPTPETKFGSGSMNLGFPKSTAIRLGAIGVGWVAVSVFVAALCFSPEATYNGHAVSYWFKRLPVLSGRPDVGITGVYAPPQGAALTECRTALKAVKALGTNAMPYFPPGEGRD
ncbi:MAG TPA: hypothetical protein VL970_11875, partial [Candidatus Acidoferrales bacterium]|nr:hypothetical protein [Candidatus Acidoferrales bacterium]